MADIHWPTKQRLRLIGKNHDRSDGPVKVTGAAKYTYDVQRPGMLYARILFSSIAKGKLVSIDTRQAEAIRGVEAVHLMAQPGSDINWAGQELVALAATSEELATEALTKIKVVYEAAAPQMNDNDPSKVEGRPRERTEGDPEQGFR